MNCKNADSSQLKVINCHVFLKIWMLLVKVVFIILKIASTFHQMFVSFIGQCKTFLVKVGSVIFSDYRLIERFTNECKEDISKFQCGRLGDEGKVCCLDLKKLDILIKSSIHLEGA